MKLLDLFGRRGPELGIAGPRDAAKLAKMHAASFRRGFREVGRRDAYYGGPGAGSRALVLRRDLL